MEHVLKLTGAVKVQERKNHKNAFSLPAIREVCKFATPTCWKGCYAKKGRMAFSSARRLYADNYKILHGKTADGMAEAIIEAINTQCRSFNNFRIHTCGDFFSTTYAQAWARVCRSFPGKTFWCYTRATDTRILDVLSKIDNMRLMLSADRDNWKTMRKLSEKFHLRITYYSVGEEPPKGLRVSIVFVDHKFRKHSNFQNTCPAETKKPIDHNFACSRCGWCLGL